LGAADLTITGVQNATAGDDNRTILFVTATGADRHVTVPSSWGVTPDVTLSSFTWTVTNGTKAEFMFQDLVAVSTNAVIRTISQ